MANGRLSRSWVEWGAKEVEGKGRFSTSCTWKMGKNYNLRKLGSNRSSQPSPVQLSTVVKTPL